MIPRYSDNPFHQIMSVADYTRANIILYSIIAIFSVVQYELAVSLNYKSIQFSNTPISIPERALAIVFDFQNNVAWIYIMVMHPLKQNHRKELAKYIAREEVEQTMKYQNKT